MYIMHVPCTPDMYDVRQACTIYVNHVRRFCAMYIQHVRCTPDMYNILALRTYNIHVTSQVKKSCLVLLFTCETYINIRITSNLFSPCGQKSGQNNRNIIGQANILRNMKDREFDPKAKL